MSYANPAHRRDNRHKVSLNSTINKIIVKSAARARKQNATFLKELIEWAIENGAVEELLNSDLLSSEDSSVA
ncbi:MULTISPECIES: hypothetical protein [Pseudomonas]|uniref:Uncharacterized protein n=1 Tax=Pseudomonas lutea TaxID=243924 RepID=A0A9X8QM42_9PSED|nr:MULTISPECIES: hypothetical protein [Pseudomonas]MBA1249880.1 hypothetical protein [Pseudomonas zeshuii]SER51414.1 hypothetical protein SAMN05216409_13214 [Pseudomonas lutea]